MRLLLVLVLVSCGGTPSRHSSTPPAAAVTQQAEDWVPVGSMLNDDVIAADVHTALAGAGIQSVAVGSLGLTVSVKASDAERARGVLRGLPDVTVVEDGDIVP